MKITDDGFILSSRRSIYANCGIIGISREDGLLGITHGYDGTLYDSNFTPEEKQELAAHMIELWKEYGAIK